MPVESHVTSSQKPHEQEDSKIFNALKDKKIDQLRILYFVKLFQKWWKNKEFLDKWNAEEFVASRCAFQGMLTSSLESLNIS